MSAALTPVILCGGGGTRLWPRSRRALPKPFLPLVGPRSLFQATLDRTADLRLFTPPLIVAGHDHLAPIESQLPQGSAARIVIEPVARNTAPAIALAALLLDPDVLMLVCPSDHHIADAAAFAEAAAAAASLAAGGWLVTFGIAAQTPETGFGYIERGEAIGAGFRVTSFVEKPDAARAAAFIAGGRHAWNGGIFVMRAGSYLAELACQRPDMVALAQDAVNAGEWDGARFGPAAAPFAAIIGESIDYAVMEGTAHAAMVPVAMGWSDIGNWLALHGALPQDVAGNAVRGPADLVDCRNMLVDSDGPRVSAIGLEGLAIVVDRGEVLVVQLADAQRVGKLPGALDQ